jgi:hypothetical protein
MHGPGGHSREKMAIARNLSRHFTAITVVAISLATSQRLPGQVIFIPNGSFESPTTSFVSINIDNWQKTPKPADYIEGGGSLWTQLTGIFQNTPTNSSDHIDNCDGNQALWLFVVPEVGLFQDYGSVDWNDTAPTHAFNATYEVGKSYHLTVGVIGTGGQMLQGASLQLSLYYRDALSNMVTVAATGITNSSDIFSNNTHLIDFDVNVPIVKPLDAWAGQNIGIQFLSTVDTNLQGGYWDLDNVRLIAGPALINPVWTNGQFEAALRSSPGLNFEILASDNLGSPLSNWNSLGVVSNASGTIQFSDATANQSQRFYRARLLP